jgi:hypothetical protein
VASRRLLAREPLSTAALISAVAPIAVDGARIFDPPSMLGLANSIAESAMSRAVLPQMLARDWGRIINIASVHGLVASVDKSAYVASKHGVEVSPRSLRTSETR